MKKALTSLALIGFLAVTMIPLVASAQAGPVKCIKLGADIKWTDPISGTTGDAPFKCKTDTEKYCLFKAGKGVGEEIGASQCGEGETPTFYQCSSMTADKPWKDEGDYFSQQASCLTNSWGMLGLLNGISVATGWIFTVLIGIVSLFIAWGAFNIVTAGGAPEKVSSGRNYIVYALIGLAVAFLAKALPSIVSALLGV